MEVEDRHLNVMVELINKIVEAKEPLQYLSVQFNPTDIIYRLSQLIVVYETNLLSESTILAILQKEPNSEPNYCLTIGSIVKLWLLDFYKHEFVTLNKLDVESGFEEEIILTTLMVLRVMYRMRQLLGQRVHQILTENWKDLHDFDQELDDKFEMKCFKLMSLLVKYSFNFNVQKNSLQKQIEKLKEDNRRLNERISSSDVLLNKKQANSPTKQQNSDPMEPLLKQLSLKRVQPIDEQKASVEVLSFTEESENNPLNGSLKSGEHSVIQTTPVKRVSKSPIKNTTNVQKRTTISSVKTLPVSGSDSSTKTGITSSPYLRTRNSPSVVYLSPTKVTKTLEERITRRSPRKIIISPKPDLQKIQKIFQEIRAVFTESDDSDNESVDQKVSINVRRPPKPIPESIPLPLKKRKTRIASPEKESSLNDKKTDLKSDQKPEQKPKKTWPSKKINYPRKKRYPCNWTNCSYIADRPSTLVRHSRAHTGEKPFACDYPGCDKRYKMSSNLTPHKLTHTGEKPYACNWADCNKQFTYPQHLKRHRISHTKRDRRFKMESKIDTITSIKPIHKLNKRIN